MAETFGLAAGLAGTRRNYRRSQARFLELIAPLRGFRTSYYFCSSGGLMAGAGQAAGAGVPKSALSPASFW
jgi:hypothetical protein